MRNERANKTLNKAAKVGFSLSLMAGSMAVLPPAAEAKPLAAQTSNFTPQNKFLFEADGLVRCENDVPVTEVKVVSYRDTGLAKIHRVVGTAVFTFIKGTNDPLYDVHVSCDNNNAPVQVDISHIVSVFGPKDFLCYNEPNLHGLPKGRCELWPALGSYSVATS